jgi:hypothetical protein
MRLSPFLRFLLLICLFSLNANAYPPIRAEAAADVTTDVVFVARAHLATEDDIFTDEVGPAGQFGSGLPKFAPGSKLMIRHLDGTTTTLVDGANPVAYLGLIDVQSPDVSFDGTKIIFAGATTADSDSSQYGWRLYEINVDGAGLRKLPIPDRAFGEDDIPRNNPNGYNFGNRETYGWWNDLFPAYLANGRIVFSSSRYPTRSHYDQRHTYNLYLWDEVNGLLRRITTDRGGFLHAAPLPDGRIMATRWWNNFNQPSSMGLFNRMDNRDYDQVLPDGTTIYANPNATFDPPTGHLPLGFPIREAPNTWHLMVLNPDGTDMHRFAFTPYSMYALTNDSGRDTYTAAQPTVVMSGTEMLIAFTSQSDSTMVHSTQNTGIRIARPDVAVMYANTADAIVGLTYDKAWNQDTSPPYALHPWGLPDGTILYSYAGGYDATLPTSGSFVDPVTGALFDLQGSQLQYQLYTMNLDGSGQTLAPITGLGTADAMDAKPIVARTGWATFADTFTDLPDDDPRYGNVPNSLPEYPFSLNGPSDILTATLHNPNVYANAPLDLPYINNSPRPGSVAYAQVYIDANQFTGAYCYGDWPQPCDTFRQDNELRAVLWTQAPVSLNGEFTAVVPADTPGFVVLRDANGRAVSGWDRGYISIAQGSAWARPGETVTCVGCHLGHVSGSIESVRPQALLGLTNIAPYAAVTASSYHVNDDPDYQPFTPGHVNDRRGWVSIPAGGPVGLSDDGLYQDDETGWLSEYGDAAGAWVELTWPLAMTATQVRLAGPPPVGGDWGGFGQGPTTDPYHVTAGTLRFYLDGVQVGVLSVGQVEPLSNGGTTITLAAPVRMDRLRFTVNSVTGYFWWESVAALNEIEVIGQASEYTIALQQVYLPAVQR